MFTLNPSGRPLSRPAQAPTVQRAPTSAAEPMGQLLRKRADITFKLGSRPKGTPGKGQFNMRTVFELGATDYLSVLDGVRQLCIIGRLDMTKSIKFQNGPLLRTVCNMVLETFPGFQEFDDPKWPIEAFIYVVLKGTAEKAKKLEKPQATPASALTEEEQAARRDLRREAQRKAALARHEARRAAALQAEAEGDPETLDIDNVNEVDNITGNISELQIEPGPVHAEAPIEPPAGAAQAEPVMASAGPSARPPAPVRSAPRRAATPLDPAPPAEPTPPMTRAPIRPTPRVPPTVPAEPAPPAAELAPPAAEPGSPAAEPTESATNPPASNTSTRPAGQPFGGSLAVVGHSQAVLSRVDSVFLSLGTPDDDDDDELSEPPTDTNSQAVAKGKGKAKVAANKGAKGGKASGDGGATGKGAGKGTKKAAATSKPVPAVTARPRRNANKQVK
ncbi:hypothetical protein FRC10_003815 [Ceratobasidium sp. 414]|nr:hypothetical protein FRC10_003815 [Ceratobasidium sp. 414]